jgi:hypothetical protein
MSKDTPKPKPTSSTDTQKPKPVRDGNIRNDSERRPPKDKK